MIRGRTETMRPTTTGMMTTTLRRPEQAAGAFGSARRCRKGRLSSSGPSIPSSMTRSWSIGALPVRMSLFELIDEENRVPHGTDESLLKKLYAAHEHDRADGEPLFSPPKVTATAKRQSTAHRLSAFVVHHFAGQVRHGALPYV